MIRSVKTVTPNGANEAPKAEKARLFFHVGENRIPVVRNDEETYTSHSIRFSDKLHERWDDLFDNFDDLRLK